MLPTDDDIKRLSMTGDPFRYAVAGFAAIELALETLIAASMVRTHRVELKRLSVGLKVDLAIALGVLSLDSKGLVLQLSRVRNFYAHEFKIGKELCSAADLKACFGKRQRAFAEEHLDAARDFTETLRVAFIIAYYELVSAIQAIEHRKKQRQEAQLEVEAVLAVIPKRSVEDLAGGDEAYKRMFEEGKARLDAAIEAKKDELRRAREAGSSRQGGKRSS